SSEGRLRVPSRSPSPAPPGWQLPRMRPSHSAPGSSRTQRLPSPPPPTHLLPPNQRLISFVLSSVRSTRVSHICPLHGHVFRVMQILGRYDAAIQSIFYMASMRSAHDDEAMAIVPRVPPRVKHATGARPLRGTPLAPKSRR